MNKNAIKKFAIDARNKLIASVTDKAGMLGITPDNCSEVITKGADFEVYKTAAGTEVTLNKKQCEQRRKMVDQIHARGFEAVVEEVAYTWFNRICAIRFMEVNDYMYPVRIRVLSSEKEGKNEPDVVTMAPEIDWDFTDKEREEIIDAKMNNRLDDLFRMLFIKQCNLLHEVLPGLFEETEDYTENILSMQPLQSQVMQRIHLQTCIITQYLIILTEYRRCLRRLALIIALRSIYHSMVIFGRISIVLRSSRNLELTITMLRQLILV